MPTQRRAFNFYPEVHRTPFNDRDTYLIDDTAFEPENASFISGYIGDLKIFDKLPEGDDELERTPPLTESDPGRQANQLGIGTVYVDPTTKAYQYGAFYTDLINQIASNGGLVNDPNRLFGVSYYAWAPPIDYDKLINFSRYYWTGTGNAEVNGEYITKEAAGSQTIIYQRTGDSLTKITVDFQTDLTTVGPVGQIIELVSNPERPLYVSDGTVWRQITFRVFDRLPVDLTGINDLEYLYVARSGPNFNRPLVWLWSEPAGRWIPRPVVIDVTPPVFPSEGMVWEDCRIPPTRRFVRFTNGQWQPLVYVAAPGPSGIGTNGVSVYDSSRLDDNAHNFWSRQNWWRHIDDLSAYDRSQLLPGDQAVRPIIEFWGTLERADNDIRDFRNDKPKFKIYSFDPIANQIVDSGRTSTIFEYRIGTGNEDVVLGFAPAFNQSGEFIFDLTLETENTDLVGYKYFRDRHTGWVRSVWTKSLQPLFLEPIETLGSVNDVSVFFDPQVTFQQPRSLTSNPDHQILTEVDRSRTLVHMSSVIASQTGFDGDRFGRNNWRWLSRDLVSGSTLIDPEQGLLRPLALLQDAALDLPNTIRATARDYNRFWTRFTNRMNRMFDDNTLADGAGILLVTPAQAVDAILTEIFIGRNESFPFHYSDMGEYIETRVFSGVADIIDPTPKSIYVPSSAPRVGVAPTFVPGTFLGLDGKYRLRGHEGMTVESFGDQRDLVWLELQNRFYNRIPLHRRTETTTESTRFDTSNLFVQDFYNNFSPSSVTMTVTAVVEDYNNIVDPEIGVGYASQTGPVYAFWNGESWLTRPIEVDDVFLNSADGVYQIYNGIRINPIQTYNNPTQASYTTNEYRRIIRRDFERWSIEFELDFFPNTTFDSNNPFTWNYSSAGIEGHYQGIYRRIYRTTRPDSRPWEIQGYTIEPSWWRTQYVPTSIAADGSPRYARTHPMWASLQAGIINPISGKVDTRFALIAPIPVDQSGNLLDPIAAGVVDEAALDMRRINDNWVYGDGSPVEQQFYDSGYYGFALALAGYLMKPVLWVDTYWSEFYRSIGDSGAIQIWRAPHIVDKDLLVRPSLRTRNTHLSTNPDGSVNVQIGLNAWIADRIQIAGQNINQDFQQIVQNTIPALAWKCAGFINTKRTTISTVSGSEIPFEDLHTVLHVSKPYAQNFCSGVVVVREDFGYRVFGFDQFDPTFRVELPAIPTVGGQVELREQFTTLTNQHRFVLTTIQVPLNTNDNDTSKFAIIVDGLRLRPEFIRVIDSRTVEIDSSVRIMGGEIVVVSVMTTISNPSTRIKKFTVRGIDFTYFAEGSGTFVDVPYGHFYETSTDVINFMIGYQRYLISQGWVFDYQDGEEGPVEDWLFGAQQFATWLVETSNPQAEPTISQTDPETFYFSPVRKQAKFQSDFGHALQIESIQNGTYGVINKLGQPIGTDSIMVSRVGNTLTLTENPVENPDDQMYGVRVYLDEIQHVVFFSNVSRFNQIIYDPVTAQYHGTLRVDTYRTNNWNGRMEPDGFHINKGELLPNFEKQAFDITRYYDRLNPSDDVLKTEQARNLYGYHPLDAYMDQVGADDRTRFNYFRGMIKAKGTLRAARAFWRGTRLGEQNVVLFEDWAWKLSEFGDTQREIRQFRVNRLDFSDKVQRIVFGPEDTAGDNTIEVADFDRANVPASTRWIRPSASSIDGLSGHRFPVDNNGIPRYDLTTFYMNLYDVESGNTVLKHFVYDPTYFKYDPEAMSQIDSVSFYDPALYNSGPKAESSKTLVWGPAQVGQLWLRLTNLRYVAYRSLAPDYTLVSQEWGKLAYLYGNVTRSGNVVTVQVYDPYDGEIVSHGKTPGSVFPVKISGADQDEYNEDFIYVTASSSTEFQYSIDSTPETPATGLIKVQFGHVELFEWVESPVPPDQWPELVARQSGINQIGGVPYFLDNPVDSPSFTVTNVLDSSGRSVTRYYFWVKNNTADNLKKKFSTQTIASRLENPTQFGLAWFAPINANQMLVYTDGEQVKDNYGIELIEDSRTAPTNVEWALIGENDDFAKVPQSMIDKMIDSMSGKDAMGNPVPSPLLLESERLGNDFFPAQTVFRDVATARQIWLDKVNEVFAKRDFSIDLDLMRLFTLSQEYNQTTNPSGYWSRTAYRIPRLYGKPVYDTVTTIAERDFRTGKKFYTFNDLIRVKQTENHDPWSGEVVGSTFEYQNTIPDPSYEEVGIDNHTVKLNQNVFSNPDRFRQVYADCVRLMTVLETNQIMFALVHEMLRQNPICDWMFKTSYVNVHAFDLINQLPFVRPNVVDAIVNNLNEVKPFHTKLRTQDVTHTVQQNEEISLGVEEFPVIKTTLIWDRLSCNFFDDGGWDIGGWDSWRFGWDTPIWELADIGRGQYELVEQFIGDSSTTVFVFKTKYDPRLYQQKLVFLLDQEEVDADFLGLTYTMNFGRDTITVTLNTPLSSDMVIQLFQTVGFYQGRDPALGSGLDESFTVTPSSYKHAAVRAMERGVQIPSALPGCNIDDPLGGNSQERVPNETEDRVLICVNTSWTADYEGWDSTPWDSTPWDSGTTDVGDRAFFIVAGPTPTIPAGIEILPTSSDYTAGTTQYIVGDTKHRVVQVYVQPNGSGPFELKTVDVDYRFVDGLPNAIEFLTGIVPGDIVRFVYNGWRVGPPATFVTLAAPGLFEIEDEVLILHTPVVESTITIQYLTSRVGDNPKGLVVRMEQVVDDILPDHTLYDQPKSIDTHRSIGTRIANTTSMSYHRWDGVTWALDGTIDPGTQFFVKRSQEIYSSSGGTVTLVYAPGGTHTNPPVLSYPLYGTGIVSSGYVLGQLPTASVDYPDAYQIMQHDGPC